MTAEKKLIITIDGPAGSGKSTTAKLLAEKLGYTYLDTGAMYRAITLKLLEEKIPPSDRERIVARLPGISIRLVYRNGKQRTYLNDRDVSEAIRNPDVTRNVSPVSGIREVREFLVAQQRVIGSAGGYVIDGRDAGTVIFPNAHIKFFLTASIEERSRRRMKEMKTQDHAVSLEKTMREIKTRDTFDETRAESPLRKPDDAIEIDNSALTLEEQTRRMLTYIKQRFPEA